MTSPKAQGSSYERHIAVLLSKWFGKQDDLFYRSQSSGGRATTRKKAGKTLKGQYGDLAATSAIGELLTNTWVIECKHGYGRKAKNKTILQWCVLDLLDTAQKVPVFVKLWQQAITEAKDAGNHIPILIIQRNRRSSIIAMPLDEFKLWKTLVGKKSPIYITIRDKETAVVVLSLDSFFTWSKSKVHDRFLRILHRR